MAMMYELNQSMPHFGGANQETNYYPPPNYNQSHMGPYSSGGEMNFPTYSNSNYTFPGGYRQHCGSVIGTAMANQHFNMDDRQPESYFNASVADNIDPSINQTRELYTYQDLDSKRTFVSPQSVIDPDINSDRHYGPSSGVSSFDQRGRDWSDASQIPPSGETRAVLDLVNGNSSELERIAATIKEDCKAPDSPLDVFLQNNPFPSNSFGLDREVTSRWNRPQQLDPTQRRKRLTMGSNDHGRYMTDEFGLANEFRAFDLQSSPPVHEFAFRDPGFGYPQGLGPYGSLPNAGGFGRPPFQPSAHNNLQTLHGASTYTPCLQNVGSDHRRIGNEGRPCENRRNTVSYSLKDRVKGNIRSRSLESHDQDNFSMKRAEKKTTGRARTSEDKSSVIKNRLKLDTNSKLSRSLSDHILSEGGNDREKNLSSPLGKRKDSDSEDDTKLFSSDDQNACDGKRAKYYFEHEEHYFVRKLLRELASSELPNELPRTTSASLFYRQLTHETEPRVMETVKSTTSTTRPSNSKAGRVVVRDDISDAEIGKYTKVETLGQPFTYVHNSCPPTSPSKSIRLLELLAAKQLASSAEKQNEEIAPNDENDMTKPDCQSNSESTDNVEPISSKNTTEGSDETVMMKQAEIEAHVSSLEGVCDVIR